MRSFNECLDKSLDSSRHLSRVKCLTVEHGHDGSHNGHVAGSDSAELLLNLLPKIRPGKITLHLSTNSEALEEIIRSLRPAKLRELSIRFTAPEPDDCAGVFQELLNSSRLTIESLRLDFRISDLFVMFLYDITHSTRLVLPEMPVLRHLSLQPNPRESAERMHDDLARKAPRLDSLEVHRFWAVTAGALAGPLGRQIKNIHFLNGYVDDDGDALPVLKAACPALETLSFADFFDSDAFYIPETIRSLHICIGFGDPTALATLAILLDGESRFPVLAELKISSGEPSTWLISLKRCIAAICTDRSVSFIDWDATE